MYRNKWPGSELSITITFNLFVTSFKNYLNVSTLRDELKNNNNEENCKLLFIRVLEYSNHLEFCFFHFQCL